MLCFSVVIFCLLFAFIFRPFVGLGIDLAQFLFEFMSVSVRGRVYGFGLYWLGI